MKPLRDSEAVPMRPERILRELGDWLPSDTIVVCDTGHAGMWSAQQFWVNKPWDFIRAAGSLGWAFPASLGAKVAMPKKPVVCFTGDGGFWYHLQELETAVRCGIPTVTVVNNNDALNQETMIFRPGLWRKAVEEGRRNVAFLPSQFRGDCQDRWARWEFASRNRPKLRSALDQALSSGRPAVVEVISDIEALAPNPWEG